MKSSCQRVWASGALAFAALHALPAHATQFIYTVTGVTTAEMYSGLYGNADPTMPAGLDFTATFVVDDALPTALYSGDALQSSAKGGGQLQDGTRPPVSGSIQIGSYSRTIRQGNFFQPYTYDPSTGDAFGTQIQELDAGVATKNVTTGRLDMYASFNRTESCCGIFFGSGTTAVDQLELLLQSPAFASADFRETGVFALDSRSSGVLMVGSITQFRSGDVYVYYEAAVGLSATSLMISAIPEPADWALMLSGMALLHGVRSRQRRGGSQRV